MTTGVRTMALALLAFWAGCCQGRPAAVWPAEDDSYLQRLRPDHPRLIFTAEDLPGLRERARTVCREEFNRLKRAVDALPERPELQFREERIERQPDGTVKSKKPSTPGYQLFEYDGSSQAVQAALLYLITEEARYAELARNYLLLAVRVLQRSSEMGQWADWQGNSRINLLCAYDWIYNALTPDERRAILLPVLNYLNNSKSGGTYTFRRSMGGVTNGNYGEDSLQLFAGLAAYGDGIDDALAGEMLRFGVRLYVDMLDYREALSAGSGLLTSSTVTYSFGPYPYATFFFFHLWRSAFGEDVSGRYLQMCDYPKWFDHAAIRFNEQGNYLTYGIGDIAHLDNYHSAGTVYTHLAQVIHFYGQSHPERVLPAYAALQRLPKRVRKFSLLYPFLPFVLTGFDPGGVDRADTRTVDRSRYFYNAGFGLLLMRSGTGEEDTYASFRFGANRTAHQQFDELSFVIYKGGFLALDAGTRCNTAQHHNYAAQTVAHNSILIHQDREPIAEFWKPWGFKPDGVTYYSHGGQNRAGAGKALALQSTEDFIYAAGDAAAAYAESKSREVIRQFLYLKPDIFVIFDRVESVEPEQKKEILFHAQTRPEQLSDRVWRIENGGVLFLNTLLPEHPAIHLEGGPGREFWASGRNWLPEGGEEWDRKYQLTGKWRLEVSDAVPGRVRSEFLHVLKAGLPPAANVSTECRLTESVAQLEITAPDGVRWELWFNRNGTPGLRLRQTGPDGAVKFDAPLPNRIEEPESGLYK